jgi:hypothetical protein
VAPEDASRADLACQHKAAVRIRDRDELRSEAQSCHGSPKIGGLTELERALDPDRVEAGRVPPRKTMADQAEQEPFRSPEICERLSEQDAQVGGPRRG